MKRATGRYYTGEIVGRRLALQVAEIFHRTNPSARSISVLDPFGGDGRLIEWLIEGWVSSAHPEVQWNIVIWDLDDIGFSDARRRLYRITSRYGIQPKCTFKRVDTFSEAMTKCARFDLVLTNPPWEILKPDRRELEALTSLQNEKYVSNMRAYDRWLGEHYPLSQPKRKFAGWGTNLSRVGFEASLTLVRQGGVVGAVLPASFLADDQSVNLRAHLLTKHSLDSVAYYPAEAKLYGSVDVASITVAVTVGGAPAPSLNVGTYNHATRSLEQATIKFDLETSGKVDFVIPVSFGAKALAIINRLANQFPTWLDLESSDTNSLWAGREIDETGVARWLQQRGGRAPLFIKGRMVGRYTTIEAPRLTIEKPNWSPPPSIKARRIAWRDVSRPSQKRRMIATLIEAGCVAGNSLGVAHFRDFAETPLLTLLGVMNSTCFEFQLRAHLATGHLSLSSLRKVAIPSLSQLRQEGALALLVGDAISSADSAAPMVDAYVAKNMYRLTEEEYQTILNCFAMTPSERQNYLKNYRELQDKNPA
ncbi:Alw26I/Eco31I/Esp3I family type II restriction adenine-specific DNA-methyltransferase [Geothrix alkalitolerans]|uniref:Alw26I/Eco31I/Esp3I family type II restriction adenine-specific DNA-methyltransferase n=1 Tax=Geothrix alkalitolerans TaxID=2922724 RepID=UPI001FAFD4F5